MTKVGFIGAGKIAQAIAKGFINSGVTKAEKIIASCHPNDTDSAFNFRSLGGEVIFNNGQVVAESEVVILSVKPTIVSVALADIRKSPEVSKIKTPRLFMSVAMGVSLAQLEAAVPEGSPVIRFMCNTAASKTLAAGAWTRGQRVQNKDIELATKLLKSIGTCDEVAEYQLDAVTAVAGSGPAFIYVLVDAMTDAGVKMGLNRQTALKLSAQTVYGAGAMLMNDSGSVLNPMHLKDDVMSPAGSTAFGLHVLEKEGFRAAIIDAVEAATKRCQEVEKLNSNNM